MTQELRSAADREWWQGWWESTVCLWEVEGDSIVQKEYTFYSEAERSAGIQTRIDAGVVYDMAWMTEQVLGGKGLPGVPVYSTEEWEEITQGTRRTVREEDVYVLADVEA
jgi:hypothetical protein